MQRKKIQILIKRIFDIVFSAILLIFLSPLLIIISLVIIFDSPGPVVFKQTRPGLGLKMFPILKFRSMKQGAEKLGLNMDEDNPQITGVGRFLRRSHLDEMPQLINILKGEMSFVGPRPPLLSQVDVKNEYEKRRFLMKPGLTGWAQLNGGNWISWQERVKYDIWYVDNFSLALDMKISFLSFWKLIVKGNGLYKKTSDN